jgi:hypothetical protein
MISPSQRFFFPERKRPKKYEKFCFSVILFYKSIDFFLLFWIPLWKKSLHPIFGNWFISEGYNFCKEIKDFWTSWRHEIFFILVKLEDIREITNEKFLVYSIWDNFTVILLTSLDRNAARLTLFLSISLFFPLSFPFSSSVNSPFLSFDRLQRCLFPTFSDIRFKPIFESREREEIFLSHPFHNAHFSTKLRANLIR